MGEEVKTRSFAEFPGGGIATTALVSQQLGTPTAIVTRIGRDAVSSPAWQKLTTSGVAVDACEVHSRLPTARTVCAAYDGDRMMITYDAINRNLEKLLMRPAVQRQLQRATHVHFACALSPPKAWISALRKLRARGITLSADIGWNPDTFASPELPVLLKEFDVVFPNEIEARAITNEHVIENAARKLAQWVRLPIIKLGPEGCIAVQQGQILNVKSLRVESVDATGAGDAFNGGFLHGYLAGWPPEDCLRAGNVCGALATTGAGGASVIPTRNKLRVLMENL
jgi:sugar/nucleoside kinase (ribokinase family)